MNQFEFMQGWERLERNFGKQEMAKANIIFEALRLTDEPAWKKCVQSVLDSEPRFPVLAVFRKHLADQTSIRPALSTSAHSSSCPRCTYGVCHVDRFIGPRKYSFAFRCECPSGNDYPGFPLVPSDEQTVKEARKRAYSFYEDAPKTV
jgi:hypothetical protein